MEYKNYKVEDFVMDAHFQEWVQHPTEQSDLFWRGWLLENPLQAEIVAEARELVKAMFPAYKPMPADKAEAIWSVLETAMKQEANTVSFPVGASKHLSMATRHKPWYYTNRVAASLAAIVLLAAALLLYRYMAATTKYTTNYGETKEIVLPDNSVVVLNANSTLLFTGDWQNKEVREVWLSGEAFFSVVHTASDQKFIVHTDNFLQVEVLGTEFNITRRKNKTRVVLENGKIKLNIQAASGNKTKKQSLLMKPGELVEFDEKADRYIKKEVNPELYSSWMSNKLLLDNTSLQEIVQMLENTYGFTITVSQADLLKQKVSGSFPLGDTHVLLQHIAQTFEVNISRTGNTIVINPLQLKK
jgi:ferric-dicitrate binding protein FerR (iron transport regulator)